MRRRHPRVCTALPVTIRVGREQHACEAVDVSLSGMRIRTTKQFRPNEKIQLSINFEDTLITTAARVARCYAEHIGIQFTPDNKDNYFGVPFVVALAAMVSESINAGQPFVDRRQNPRINLRIALIHAIEPNQYEVLWTRDLSESGAQVEVNTDRFKIGQNLEFLLSEYGVFSATARVARILDFGIGVEFQNMEPNFKQALTRINQHARRQESGDLKTENI